MSLLRSAQFPAILLLLAAVAGLAVANSGAGPEVIEWSHTEVGLPGTPFDLSLSHWVSDGLLAIFFFGVSVELQFELTRGELRSARRAIQPAIAAVGGVIVPVVIYLAIVSGSGLEKGWPIPTATDVAFALGVLAVFGRGLPSSVRVFLLALAIIDDVIGIVFIAVLFASDVNIVMLLAGVLCVVGFGVLSRIDTKIVWLRTTGLILLALAAWGFVLASGVHATIAGVMLGLAMAQEPALHARHALEPWINVVILPIFAFFSALVAIPELEGEAPSPVFWAILVALPFGKLIGISVAGWAAQKIFGRPGGSHLALGDIIAAASLGGIGFTVSLLLANLAFEGDEAIRDQAILGVIGGSLAAMVLAAILLSVRARHYKRLAEEEEDKDEEEEKAVAA